ncbi:hypothetical protein LTR85_009003 [Meristemomyces frigidus]|nr:hypothetical protein LTR85_009003 [Meristemomyces frigidus]
MAAWLRRAARTVELEWLEATAVSLVVHRPHTLCQAASALQRPYMAGGYSQRAGKCGMQLQQQQQSQQGRNATPFNRVGQMPQQQMPLNILPGQYQQHLQQSQYPQQRQPSMIRWRANRSCHSAPASSTSRRQLPPGRVKNVVRQERNKRINMWNGMHVVVWLWAAVAVA